METQRINHMVNQTNQGNMKQTLFFILLFAALTASAQTQTVTLDTTYTVNSGGNFFEVSRIEYSNGAYSEKRDFLGDTLTIYNRYVAKIESEANEMATAAATAYRLRQKTTDWAKLDTVTTARLLRSPITGIMDVYEKEFLTGNWQIEFSGTTAAATFPRLSSNKRIRLQANGTARTMLIYGKVMRLVNYPFTGLNTLFQLREGYWINLEYGNPATRVILRRISN
jgi:hypothetical protein